MTPQLPAPRRCRKRPPGPPPTLVQHRPQTPPPTWTPCCTPGLTLALCSLLADVPPGPAPGTPRPSGTPPGTPGLSLGGHPGGPCHPGGAAADARLGRAGPAAAEDSAVTLRPEPPAPFKARSYLFIYFGMELWRSEDFHPPPLHSLLVRDDPSRIRPGDLGRGASVPYLYLFI